MALFIFTTANPEDLCAHSLSMFVYNCITSVHSPLEMAHHVSDVSMEIWEDTFDRNALPHDALMISHCRSVFHAIKPRFWISKMPILFGTTIFGAGIYMGYVELINMDTDTNLTRPRLRRLMLWHLQFTVAVHGCSFFCHKQLVPLVSLSEGQNIPEQSTCLRCGSHV